MVRNIYPIIPGGKTLKQLWEENNKKLRFFVESPTNGIPKYELLTVCVTKNYAILSHRGRGLKWFRKYYDIFVLDNPRWFRI